MTPPEDLNKTLLAEVRQLRQRVDQLHQKLDSLQGIGATAEQLRERLEDSERRRRELGDQAAHLIELLGDARRSLDLARTASADRQKPG